METINVPRELVEYAVEVLLDCGCLKESYEEDCPGCLMRIKGEQFQALLADSASPSQEGK